MAMKVIVESFDMFGSNASPSHRVSSCTFVKTYIMNRSLKLLMLNQKVFVGQLSFRRFTE